MKEYSLLYVGLCLITVLAILNFIAISFYFYWIFWWFDMMIHFLAGLTGGLIAIWFLFDSKLFYRHVPGVSGAIFGALIAIITVGVAWEIFEYVNGLTQSTEAYATDTTYDLIADMLGAVLAGIIGSREVFHSRA